MYLYYINNSNFFFANFKGDFYLDILENDKLNIATKIKLGSTQVKNIVNIGNVEEDNKITKVLTVSAKPIIENISVNNASVKFDGVVDYDLLVVLENNEIKPLTQKTNFSQVFEDTKINVTLPEQKQPFVLPPLSAAWTNISKVYDAD